jgi:hypothetical protein
MPLFILPLILVFGAFAPLPQTPTPTVPVVTVALGDLAIRTVKVALRTAGISERDAEVDRIATRARVSALMPEVSVRATQTEAGIKDYSSDTGTVSTSEYGPGFSLQASLTFHLDKLVYSGQESRIERLRIERMDARTRISQKIIDEIGKWSRALAEERMDVDSQPGHLDAMVRRTNAQMALDVWTGGWFSAFLDGKAR